MIVADFKPPYIRGGLRLSKSDWEITDEPLSCPFCGTPGKLTIHDVWYSIYCECEDRTVTTHAHSSPWEAVRLWNTRNGVVVHNVLDF